MNSNKINMKAIKGFKLVVTIIAQILICTTLCTTDNYVAPTGGDSNSGTLETAPFQSVQYTIDVDNSKQAVTIEVEVEQGAADLTAWLEQADGVLSNAFYIYVMPKLKKAAEMEKTKILNSFLNYIFTRNVNILTIK